jgi:hypothetical protein
MGLTFLTADIFIIFSFNRWGQAVLFFAVKQKAVKQKRERVTVFYGFFIPAGKETGAG